ncbi:MAG: DUF6261 family protein [Dysgonamonadaceae bacterium]|jgi:hypothetical protein|nr:DUF6261 family protein [Dysgonamonadaceae bacterium]
MKIQSFYLYRIRHEEHYQFLLRFRGLLETHPQVAGVVSTMLPEFNELFNRERQLVDAEKSSRHTEKIAVADRRRDRAIVGITAAVKSFIHHFDPEVVTAAKSIRKLVKAFRKEISKKSYSEESTAIEVFVDELHDKYEAQVALLGLNEWVTELAVAQSEFVKLFTRRNSERAAKPKVPLGDIRKQVDAVYREMTDLIVAYTKVNGEENCALFIDELNAWITYFKVHGHGHRHAKKSIKNVTVSSIPEQVYTGEPVIVLPEVFYKDEKLVFAVDYELSYQNNNRVGTAALFIHGKGAYKGKMLMSFNIVEKRE